MFPHYSFHPPPSTDRKWRPKVEELAPNCPRCDSSNTKFCYYNNYCLTQPRYLCKGCRRYWTKGGSLRNIPVGGGYRKNRRGKSVKLNSTVSTSLSSPPNSFRPDHALDNMSGKTCGSFRSPDLESLDLSHLYAKFLDRCPNQLEQQEAVPLPMMMPFFQESLERQSSAAEAVLRNNYVEKRLIGVENNFLRDELLEVQDRGRVIDYNNDYLMGSNNYVLETDLMWESSRIHGIAMAEMAQQNVGCLTSLEAFL